MAAFRLILEPFLRTRATHVAAPRRALQFLRIRLTLCDKYAELMAIISATERAFRLGPSGGTGGLFFEDKPAEGTQIAKIYVHFGDYIDGLRIEWADGTDAYHGSCNGPVIVEFAIDHQNGEKLRGFDGSIGAHPGDGGPYVTAIRFHTETRSSEVLGKPFSNSFTYERMGQYGEYSIIGFFGRAGKYIDSIGPLLA